MKRSSFAKRHLTNMAHSDLEGQMEAHACHDNYVDVSTHTTGIKQQIFSLYHFSKCTCFSHLILSNCVV